MQLDIYARFTSQDNVQRENTFARAVCSDDLYDIYYDGSDSDFVFSIVSSTIVLPIVFFIIIVISVRRLNSDVMRSFTDPSNHDDFVTLAVIGVMVSVFIITVDISAASAVAEDIHEYATEITGVSINMYVVFITLVFDLIFFIPLLLCILYIIYINIIQFFGCENKCTCTQFLRCCCTVFIGKVSLKSIEELSDDETIAVVLPVMFATPLMCLSSHIGYILLAWVTEPAKSTTILILYYIILIYFFVSLRKLYRIHSRMRISLKCGRQERGGKDPKEVINIELDVITKDDSDSPRGGGHQTASQLEGAFVTDSKKPHSCCLGYHLSYVKADIEHINPQAFCLLIFYSVFVVSFAVFVICIFLLLPIVSTQLITYLFNAVELVVVFITTYLAFRLFFSSDFSLKKTMESFRAYYAQKNNTNNQELTSIARDEKVELETATGALAAGFTRIIVHQYNPDL